MHASDEEAQKANYNTCMFIYQHHTQQKRASENEEWSSGYPLWTGTAAKEFNWEPKSRSSVVVTLSSGVVTLSSGIVTLLV